MKLSESCSCGAEITAEGAPLTCRAEVQQWRDTHQQRCYVELWRRSAGTVAGQFEIGFSTNDTSDRRAER